jgi:hypothetical protein
MRTHGVEVDAPSLDQPLGFGDAGEPVLVQAFVTEVPVEAFDERVFDRLAGTDEAEPAARARPGVEGATAAVGTTKKSAATICPT